MPCQRRPSGCPKGCPYVHQDHGETMTTNDDSLILEQIERESAERQASDARLHAMLENLHGAFNAAIRIARGDARG